MNYSKFFKISLISTTIPISYLLYKKNYCYVNLDTVNKQENKHENNQINNDSNKCVLNFN